MFDPLLQRDRASKVAMIWNLSLGFSLVVIDNIHVSILNTDFEIQNSNKISSIKLHVNVKNKCLNLQ